MDTGIVIDAGQLRAGGGASVLGGEIASIIVICRSGFLPS